MNRQPYQKQVKRVPEAGEFDPGLVIPAPLRAGSHWNVRVEQIPLTELFDYSDLRARFE